MKTLYILSGFNNYYNRMVKLPGDTTEDYPEPIHILDATNFVPNDGVNTEHVVGTYDYDGTGDYLLVTEMMQVPIDDNDPSTLAWKAVVVQRWFIIDSVRNRQGQYTLTLRRDLIADYYNIITQSPMFIEKATISNINDPALFNREGLKFNQIKQSETLLKDETNCPWIVGYIPETLVKGNDYNGETLIFDYSADSKDFLEVDTLSDWDGYDWYSGSKKLPGTIEEFYYGYGVKVPSGGDYHYGGGSGADALQLPQNELPANGYYFFKNGSSVAAVDVSYNSNYGNKYQIWNSFQTWLPSDYASVNPNFQQFAVSTNIFGSVTSHYIYYGHLAEEANDFSNVQMDELLSIFKRETGYQFDPTEFKNKYEGQLIKDASTGLFYKVRVVKSLDLSYSKNWAAQDTESFQYLNGRLIKSDAIDVGVASATFTIQGEAGNYTYFTSASYYTYTLNLEPIYQYAGVTLDSSVYELNDQPYFMFCVPYTNEITVVNKTDIKYVFNKDIAISLATQFAGKAGKNNVFDIQLLPFCPARYAVRAFMPTPGWNGTSGTGEYANVTTPYIFDEDIFNGLFQPIVKGTKEGENPIVLTDQEVGKIFWATSGNFSFDINYSIPNKTTALEVKLASETELYRLCSPNYSGIFEFDPYMNAGVETFNVDCSYKPFNPYIHINPNFKYLYGSDYNDQRGLIIQGDFSLPQETNAWADYELNNKNYQAIFDRGIQNLKVNQEVQREQQIFNAITGTVMGGAAGAVSGAKGGVAGIVAGALVGTAASAIGGALDVSRGDILRNEALDYSHDLFNYNLGNIQALPNGMTKTSPLTANFKYFPYIEKYSCTPIEKQALKDKLTYNGMTVMRIGTMNEFLNINSNSYNYIKGQLIRLEDFEEDFHIVNSIAGELYKGVFIK